MPLSKYPIWSLFLLADSHKLSSNDPIWSFVSSREVNTVSSVTPSQWTFPDIAESSRARGIGACMYLNDGWLINHRLWYIFFVHQNLNLNLNIALRYRSLPDITMVRIPPFEVTVVSSCCYTLGGASVQIFNPPCSPSGLRNSKTAVNMTSPPPVHRVYPLENSKSSHMIQWRLHKLYLHEH